MQISVPDNKLRRALSDDTELQKRFGVPMAKKIRLRLAALDAAISLADFWPPFSGPERCHELLGDKVGMFSMDVQQPYRLLFKPNLTAKSDQSEEAGDEGKSKKEQWEEIRAIEIESIEDTHG